MSTAISRCKRCRIHPTAIIVRTEALCETCFGKYVESKVAKRVGSFRARNGEPGKQRLFLLALSFGTCSVALVHILSLILQGQIQKSGRTGFRLHVLNVNDGLDDMSSAEAAAIVDRLKQRYPEHEYATTDLSALLTQDDLPGIVSNAESSDAKLEKATMADILNAPSTATSKADVRTILRNKAIVNYAKSVKCDAVLWGDSTTRLALRVLADTAKGRGSALPWAVLEGDTPYGMAFCYPLRDLLTKELDSYVSFLQPPLTDAIIARSTATVSASSRNTTIDDLMRQYFETVEKEYPSIVANVVKTAGKLNPTSLAEVEQSCELCEMPLQDAAPERSRLCYGCIRILPVGAG